MDTRTEAEGTEYGKTTTTYTSRGCDASQESEQVTGVSGACPEGDAGVSSEENAPVLDTTDDRWNVFASSADLENKDDCEVDIDKCVDALNVSDHTKSQIKMHVEAHGVRGMDTVLLDMLEHFKTLPVNIAMIGRTGTGKSSLINCFRNLRATDPGAAKVGTIETTTKIHPYKYPDCDNFLLWDVPGVNTQDFPRDIYLDKIEFPKYDAFIIVCTDRVTADDIWLAERVHAARKHFYFVRTKIDLDYSNSIEDGFDPDEELPKIRQNIEECLMRANLPTEHIFLVSGRLTHQTRWDFPKLTQLLTTKTPQKDEQTMTMSMVSCSKDMISLKRDKLKRRVDIVALNASTATTIRRFQEIVLNEIREYTKWFGITDVNLQKWQVDIAKLEPKLKKIKRMLNDSLLWLKVDIKSKQFVLGAFGFFLEFFEISASLQKKLENLQNKESEEVEKAKRKGSELKRTTAQDVLTQALTHCHELAVGILVARQNNPC